MSNDRKSRVPRKKSVLDNLEEFPTVRKIQLSINSVQEMILRRAPAPELLYELGKLRDLLMQLESGILKNHLKGCFHQALIEKDIDAVEDTLQRLADHLLRKEEK